MTTSMDIPSQQGEQKILTKVAFEQPIQTPIDAITAQASGSLLQEGIIDARAELATDENDEPILRVFTVEGRREAIAQAALFQGIHSIVNRTVEKHYATMDADELTEYAKGFARDAVTQITSNEDLQAAFNDYYGGMRMSMDSDKLINRLFLESTPYDPDFAKNEVTGRDLNSLVYTLDLTEEIPYKQRDKWPDTAPNKIYDQMPALNPAQLDDPEFRASEDGRKLEKAYAHIQGERVVRQYNDIRGKYLFDGEKPLIPLTQFPLIEALMADSVSYQKPSSKYSFGPSSLIDEVLASDSKMAREALIESLMYRLPREDRYVFDGPDELEQKHRVVNTIIYTYAKENNPELREELQGYLLDILKAYQGDGVIAQSIQDETAQGMHTSGDYRQVRDIVKSVMVAGMSSERPELFIRAYRSSEKSLVLYGEEDSTKLSKADLVSVLMDSISKSSIHTSAHTFEEFAKEVFEDDALAATLREVAELYAEAHELFRSPAVEIARKALGGLSLGGSRKDEAARENFNEATRPSTERSQMAASKLNDFIFSQLSEALPDDQEAMKIANILIKKISFTSTEYNSNEFPSEYAEIKKLLENDSFPTSLKATLLWHFGESTKYNRAHEQYLSTIIDGHHALLGSPNNLKSMDSDILHTLYALEHIAGEHRVFQYANAEQLQECAAYKIAALQLVDRIQNGQLTSSESKGFEDGYNKALRDAESLVRYFKGFEEHYQEYLYLEEVKVNPHTYYDWFNTEMTPVWHGLEWEVGPGQRPSRALSDLHAMMKNYITNSMVTRNEGEQYDEDFDVIEDGSLGTIMYESYRRMVPTSDLHYTTTVWQKGRPFVHHAAQMMPQSLVNQLAEKYSHDPNFVKYITNKRK